MDPIKTVGEDNRHSQISVASGCNLVLGGWMILAPFVLGYTTAAALWNSVIFGVLVAIFAWIRLANKSGGRSLSIWNAVFGAWLIIAPFALGYHVVGEIWNSVIAGVLILALGAWSGSLAFPSRQVSSH